MRNREKSLVFIEIKIPIFSEERYVFLRMVNGTTVRIYIKGDV